MADGDNFEVQYTGQAAKTLQEEITERLTEAHDAYDGAVDDWDAIRAKFTVDSDIESQFETVTLTGKSEVAKIFEEMNTLLSGVNNIDTSWKSVAEAVSNALKAYNSDSEGGN